MNVLAQKIDVQLNKINQLMKEKGKAGFSDKEPKTPSRSRGGGGIDGDIPDSSGHKKRMKL